MDTRTQAFPVETDLINRVVAWHNRHWMSRRITPDQVTGVGVVGLPFAAAPDNGTGDALPAIGRLVGARHKVSAWLRKPRSNATQHLFDEDFIPPLKLAQVASFAARHGSNQRPGDPAWPQRDIPLANGKASGPVALRFLQSAAIEVGKHRLRVLIGIEADPAIIGPRLWNRKRLLAGLATAGLLVLTAALPLVWPAATPVAVSSVPAAATSVMPIASAVLPPAVETASTSAIEPANHPAPKDEPSEAVPTAAAGQASAAIAKGAPADAEAKRQARQLEDASLTVSNLDRPAPQTLKAADKILAPPAAPKDAERLYAVATQPTRSRMGSQLRIALLNLPTEPQVNGAHAEVLQVGKKWRAVIWPFADRESAESIRQALAARGIEVEVINF